MQRSLNTNDESILIFQFLAQPQFYLNVIINYYVTISKLSFKASISVFSVVSKCDEESMI